LAFIRANPRHPRSIKHHHANKIQNLNIKMQIIKNPNPHIHRFSHTAMATIFEILICHDEEKYAKKAAQEVFSELDRLEQDFSRFIENSDISRINNLAVGESTRIGSDTFECLLDCADLYIKTKSAFDISIGSLMKCWLEKNKSLRNPTKDEIDRAKQKTGFFHLQLDETDFSVTMLSGPVLLDLGGFGKGYAVDRMAELLIEWSVTKFLIHGGKSSVLAGDAPDGEMGWRVSITNPLSNQIVKVIWLENQAMSGSGLQKGFHIIDPRTAHPVKTNHAVWAFAPTAAISDGLSTAFLIMNNEEIEEYCMLNPDVKSIAVIEENKENIKDERILRFGNWSAL
jgi:FAD:protein FMN transferase